MWLFDKVMFTSNHVNTVDARYIGIAREIADARCREDIVQRSWGSAVLAATLRAMCNACRRRAEKSAVLGCPLLLQLWSYERFPIGRPDVHFDVPYDDREYHGDLIDMPTFGTLWTRRRVSFVLNIVSYKNASVLSFSLIIFIPDRYDMLANRSGTATQPSQRSSIPCTLVR